MDIASVHSNGICCFANKNAKHIKIFTSPLHTAVEPLFIYTPCPEKETTLLLPLTLPHVN